MVTKTYTGSSMQQLIKATIALLVMAVSVSAVNVDFVGSIEDQLFAPTSIAIGDGQLAVLEPFAQRLKLFSADGIMSHNVDIRGNANGLQQLSENTYLFCDRSDKKIVAVNLDDSTQYDFLAGTGLVDPLDLLVLSDRIFVLDAGTGQVIILDRNGAQVSRFDLINDKGQSIGYASSFALDESLQQLYVFDQIRSTVSVYSDNGVYVSSFGSFGASDGEITRGGKILAGNDGHVYLTDRFQSRVVVFDNTGEFVTNIDLAESGDRAMALPTGLAIDNTGLLYVASTESATIHIFHIQHVVAQETFATTQLTPLANDTVGTQAVRLTAEVVYSGDAQAITGFDFELFNSEDTLAPIDSARQISPSIPSADNNRAVVAEWVVEKTLEAGSQYEWRVRPRTKDTTGAWSAMRTFYTAVLPVEFQLHQNYPNPFNPETRITFSVPSNGHVLLEVFDLLGRKTSTLVDEQLPAGNHEITWTGTSDNGKPVATGVYFYRLVAGEHSKTKKMVYLK